MKKLVSLCLALALCLGLTVPALAESSVSIWLSEGDGNTFENPSAENTSGTGWTYDPNPGGIPVLTLNGVHSKEGGISITDSIIIELAPGSKNSVTDLNFGFTQDAPSTITIRGSGELILDYSDYRMDAFGGRFHEVKFADNLTVTGGRSRGDTSPLTISQPDKTNYRCLTDGKESAFYARIAPAADSAPAAPQTPSAPQAPATSFTDVPANSPYAEAIQWAVENGITTGTTPTTFSPNSTCTNRQVLTFLWRSKGRPYTTPFGDEPNAPEWTHVYDWGFVLGLLNLADFPDQPCTRSSVIWTLWILAHQPKPSKAASFTDMPSSAGTAQAISWAVEKGITTGTSATTFSPDNICTRGQVMTFLYRASK